MWRLLEEKAEMYAQVKEQSIATRIEEMLVKAGPRGRAARIVRGVLQERAGRMAEIRDELQDLISEEKGAFSQWRECVTRGRRVKGFAKSHPEAASRKRLIAGLPDLLLDEAFLQYKGYRAPARYREQYSGDTFSRRARAPGLSMPGDRTRYGEPFRHPPRGYDSSRNRNQRYFR